MLGAARFDAGDLVLDRYRLTDIIGEGGVGVVWRATDERATDGHHGRVVAVKVLGAHATRNRTARQRMEREAQTLGTLSHPNLVALLDYAIVDDTIPVLVMEYFPGESLQHRIERVGALGVLQTAMVMQQVLSALVVCHRVGVIHRDLKPGNLLLRLGRDGQPETRIIDFGIVQLLADDGATALTLNGEVFGSPRYMSPEQWQQRAVDPRTDVYAIGLIGYALLTGKHFIQADNPIQAFEAHLGAPRPLLTTTANGEAVPPPLAAAVARACHPDPGQRFAGVEAMRLVMDALLTPSGSWSAVARTLAVEAVTGFEGLDFDPGAETFEGEVDDSVLDDLGDVLSDDALASQETPAGGHDLDATVMDMGQMAGFAAALAALPLPQPPGAADAGGREAGDARLGFPGEENTAITRGDFERALKANSGAGAATAANPSAKPEVGPVGARGGLRVARIAESSASQPARPVPVPAPGAARPTLPGPPSPQARGGHPPVPQAGPIPPPPAAPTPAPAAGRPAGARPAGARPADARPAGARPTGARVEAEPTDRSLVPDAPAPPRPGFWRRFLGWLGLGRRR